MHLWQHELCTRKTELALEMKFYHDFHWVTWPWRRTLTNGSDVFPQCRTNLSCKITQYLPSCVQTTCANNGVGYVISIDIICVSTGLRPMKPTVTVFLASSTLVTNTTTTAAFPPNATISPNITEPGPPRLRTTLSPTPTPTGETTTAPRGQSGLGFAGDEGEQSMTVTLLVSLALCYKVIQGEQQVGLAWRTFGVTNSHVSRRVTWYCLLWLASSYRFRFQTCLVARLSILKTRIITCSVQILK